MSPMLRSLGTVCGIAATRTNADPTSVAVLRQVLTNAFAVIP